MFASGVEFGRGEGAVQFFPFCNHIGESAGSKTATGCVGQPR